MSQSVKFKDGSYLDSSSVWDVASGQSQADVNNGKQDALKVIDVEIDLSNYTFTAKGNFYVAYIPIANLIGESTKVYSVTISGYSSKVMELPLVGLSANSELIVFADMASPDYSYTVKIVYV